MLLPHSCLRFGPPQNQTMTVGTSQMDQAQTVKELKKWVQQQDETLRTLYGEEVELTPLPLLLEEMEECFGETDWVAVGFLPKQSRSSPVRASSKPRHPHHKRFTPAAAAAPAKLGTPTAALAESSPPPPAAAEFPAGFSSCPGRCLRRRSVAIGDVRSGASYLSTEGPSAMASSRLFSPESEGGCPAPSGGRRSSERPPTPAWILAGLQFVHAECMKERCMECVPHLLAHPQDLLEVHAVLQVEFLEEGWLDAPAPLSAGGPFTPLLEAVSAAAGPPEPQPAAAGPPEPQLAAAGPPEPSDPSDPRLTSEGPVGGLPPRPGPEHLLGFLWGVLKELIPDSRSASASDAKPDILHATLEPDTHSATPEPDTHPATPEPDTHPATPEPDTHSDKVPGGSSSLLGRPPGLLPGSKPDGGSTPLRALPGSKPWFSPHHRPPRTTLRGFPWPRRRPTDATLRGFLWPCRRPPRRLHQRHRPPRPSLRGFAWPRRRPPMPSLRGFAWPRRWPPKPSLRGFAWPRRQPPRPLHLSRRRPPRPLHLCRRRPPRPLHLCRRRPPRPLHLSLLVLDFGPPSEAPSPALVGFFFVFGAFGRLESDLKGEVLS
ncbi:hypothetical protein CRENBAI_012273 [Crenichthys baileyi]|uniref:Uncharacterized protein n=1 Tax=Crenichthys baileyi TaxID=28760 RepID=A0AAV9QPH7_9TELE